MSILDSIKENEAKAEKIRLEATNEVKALLEATKKLTEERIKLLFEQEQKNTTLLQAETKAKISAKEKELDAHYLNLDNKMIKKAESKIDEAVDFILKKVDIV